MRDAPDYLIATLPDNTILTCPIKSDTRLGMLLAYTTAKGNTMTQTDYLFALFAIYVAMIVIGGAL